MASRIREHLPRMLSAPCPRSDLVFPGHSVDLLATLPTKRTPIFDVQFTPRNLCLAAGPMLVDS